MWTDGQSDITRFLTTAAFCNFTNMPKKDQLPVLIQESPDLHDSESGNYHTNVILQKLSFYYGRVNVGKVLVSLF